jgi:uncharacterized membrane protein required for colicin V production
VTWIDWAIVSVVLFSALHGLRHGVIAAFLGLVGVIIAYLAASIWYRPLASLISEGTHLVPAWANTVAYGALLVSVYFLIGTVAAIIADSYGLSGPKRVLGFLAGAAKGTLLAAALLGLLLASPVGRRAEDDARKSALAPLALRLQQGGAQSLARVLPDSIHPFGAQEMRF